MKVGFARCNPVIRMAWIKCGYCTFGDMGRWHYEGHLTTFVSPKYMICNNMYFFIYIYTHMWRERERARETNTRDWGSELASVSAFMAEVMNPKQHLIWHRGSLN